MLEARIHLLVLAAGVDQLHGGPRRSGAAGYLTGSRHILGGIDACRVVGRTGRGGAPKYELMGREAGSLVGLEHIVRPAIAWLAGGTV